MALYQRSNTGVGQLVDACLFRAGIWVMSHCIVSVAHGTPGEEMRGSQRTGERTDLPTWQSFRTAGGGAIQLLGLETKRHWGNTMKALNLNPTPELKKMQVRIPGVCLHACVCTRAYVRAYVRANVREQNASVVLDYWCVQICIAGLGHMLKRKEARVC